MNPSFGKRFALFKEACTHYISQDVKRVLEKISEAYEVCDEHSVPPLRFRAIVPEENIILNREIAMGIMWLNGKPVLHLFLVERNFQNAIFISGKTSNEL